MVSAQYNLGNWKKKTRSEWLANFRLAAMRRPLFLVREKKTKGHFTSFSIFLYARYRSKVYCIDFPLDLHCNVDVAVVVPVSQMREPRLRAVITCSRSYSQWGIQDPTSFCHKTLSRLNQGKCRLKQLLREPIPISKLPSLPRPSTGPLW